MCPSCLHSTGPTWQVCAVHRGKASSMCKAWLYPPLRPSMLCATRTIDAADIEPERPWSKTRPFDPRGSSLDPGYFRDPCLGPKDRNRWCCALQTSVHKAKSSSGLQEAMIVKDLSSRTRRPAWNIALGRCALASVFLDEGEIVLWQLRAESQRTSVGKEDPNPLCVQVAQKSLVVPALHVFQSPKGWTDHAIGFSMPRFLFAKHSNPIHLVCRLFSSVALAYLEVRRITISLSLSPHLSKGLLADGWGRVDHWHWMTSTWNLPFHCDPLVTKLTVSFGQFKELGHPFNSVLEDAIELFVVPKPPSHAKSTRPGGTLQTTPEFGEVELGETKIESTQLTCHLMLPTVMERESTSVLWKTTHEHAWWVSCLGIKHRSWANLCLKPLKCFAGGNGMTQDFGSKSPFRDCIGQAQVRPVHPLPTTWRHRGGCRVCEVGLVEKMRSAAGRITEGWGIWKCLLDLVGTDLYFPELCNECSHIGRYEIHYPETFKRQKTKSA